jgi:tetratricopeptide (TPR) repeat protein
MAELDPAELASVLDSAQQLLSNYDYDGAYQLLAPVAQANAATGADLARVNRYLGDACMGLGSLDAAMQYYEAGLTGASAEDAEHIRGRITDIREYDSAVEATSTDGVAGEDEADRVLATAMDALIRNDFGEARLWYEYAWNGIQMSDYQIAGVALGLFKCAIHDGQLDEAEGYLQIAEARSPDHASTVAVYRQDLATRRAGASLGEDGVQMTELDEINQSALQASWDGDYANAKRLFEQMLESALLPATDRGRIHRNIGVMQIYLHDYEGARASFEEAARVGTSDIQAMAQASLAQLDANASAADIVAGIDLSAN